MIRKSKLLICMLFVSMILTAIPDMESRAEELEEGTTSAESELQDENSQRLEELTVMDEDGSISEIGDTDGTVDTESTNEGIALFSSDSNVKVVNFNTKGNAVTYYTKESGNEEGYTNGAYGADGAYLGTTSDGKIRFMLSGVTGVVEASDVQLLDYEDVSGNVSYYMVSGGKLVHHISQNLTKSTSSSLNNGTAPSYLKEGVKYYSYDGKYFYTDYAKMLSDYQNDKVGASSVNSSSPFQNKYQFLDMRGTVDYNADQLEQILQKAMKNAGVDASASKLTGTAASFVTYQNTYNVNALLSLSIAINESGWGKSSICNSSNNLFGLNAIDTSAAESAFVYNSIDACIRDFMANWMAERYLGNNWRNHGEWLGNKGSGINVSYASDPYWGEKAAAIAWNLDAIGESLDFDSESENINSGDSSGGDTEDTDKTEADTEDTDRQEAETDTNDSDVDESGKSSEKTDSLKGSVTTVSEKEESSSSSGNTDSQNTASEEKGEIAQMELSDSKNLVTIRGELSAGASVSVDTLLPDTDRYQALTDAEDLDGETVIGIYDVHLDGKLEGEVELTFHVGTEYNGKTVTILHYTDEAGKVYEVLEGKVKDGTVTVKVDSFSPFVLALQEQEDEAAEVTVTEVTSAPKTGDDSQTVVWSILCLISAAAILIVIKNRKMLITK